MKEGINFFFVRIDSKIIRRFIIDQWHIYVSKELTILLSKITISVLLSPCLLISFLVFPLHSLSPSWTSNFSKGFLKPYIPQLKTSLHIIQQEKQPWWKLQLENEMYIYQVNVKNSPTCCGSDSSIIQIKAAVQRDIHQPGTECGSALAYGEHSEYTFRCHITIKGRFVTISLSGEHSQLVLCLVDVNSFGR